MRRDGGGLAVTEAGRPFDLTAEPLGIAAQLSRDPLLAPLVRRLPGVRVPGTFVRIGRRVPRYSSGASGFMS